MSGFPGGIAAADVSSAAPGLGLAASVALVAACLTTVLVDRLAAQRGFDPPGFSDPLRRLLAGLGLALLLLFAVFLPATTFNQSPEIDTEALDWPQIFVSPLLLLLWLVLWLGCGFVGVRGISRRRFAVVWRGAIGLRSRNIIGELTLGLAVGLAAWFAVLVASFALGLVLSASGRETLVAQEPAQLIVWMAGLPVTLRLAISLAAGVSEEIFFRGFLQPRIGIGLSSLLFVGAHLGYGQPLMLFGITLLSLIYAALARWRGSVWAAISAHFLFDAVQLLVVIPTALRAYETTAQNPVALLF
ncbi:MAG: CPBP family intramembrane glutamic endopeptidase [Acidobacteriota bacterium]